MENKERDALIESIYEEVDSLSDKLYNIVWEPQEPTRKNHFDTLPKGERVALVGLLNDACRFRNSLSMYISWFKHNPECVGQVIRRKGNVRIIMTGEFFFCY